MVKKRKKRSGRERKLNLEYVPIEELQEWKRNPRKGFEKSAKKLAKLFGRYGFINPIVATPDKVIRAGHTRIKAARLSGMKEVPVIFVDFANEQEAEDYAIADNKSSEWNQWEEDLLKQIISGRSESLADVSEAMGYTEKEIEGLYASELSMASKNFREMAEEFEREHAMDKEKPLWVWFVVPDRKTKDRLLELYGIEQEGKKKGAGGELDFEVLKDKGLYVRRAKAKRRKK